MGVPSPEKFSSSPIESKKLKRQRSMYLFIFYWKFTNFVNVEIKQNDELLKQLKEINKEGKQQIEKDNELYDRIIEYNYNMMKSFTEKTDKMMNHFQTVANQNNENMKILTKTSDILFKLIQVKLL